MSLINIQLERCRFYFKKKSLDILTLSVGIIFILIFASGCYFQAKTQDYFLKYPAYEELYKQCRGI